MRHSRCCAIVGSLIVLASRWFRSSRVIFVGIALALAACETGLEPAPGDPAGPEEPSDPRPGLECGGAGHPCSLSDVPTEILQQSDSLGDEVLAMWDEGASTAEAAAWLTAQDGMAEVESDDTAIRFRLEGGRGTWILQEDALGGPGIAGGAAPSYRMSPGVPEPSEDVVAPESEEKRALVLSPFLWDFGGTDDGPLVTDILSATRGYEGRVVFRANRDTTSSVVGIESFTGWRNYEVIHVATHGARLNCTFNTSACRAVIFARLLFASPGEEYWEQLEGVEQTGVEYVKAKTRSLSLVDSDTIRAVALSADFFRNEYTGGLDDAVVFLNGCETFGAEATDLVDAIQGSGAVVLGWTEPVDSYDAGVAAIALYRELSEGGYPAEVAYSKLEGLKFASSFRSRSCLCLISPELRISKRPKGGDLHIREVVTLLDPLTSQLLTARNAVNIVGTQGDGVPDEVPYLIQVDGIQPEFAGGMTVHFSLDGDEAEPLTLTDGEVNDNDQWTVRGTLSLGYDLEEDKMANFRAWAELYTGGETDHETPATLTGETSWRFEATHTSFWTDGFPDTATPYTATADLILGLEVGQDPGEPKPRYVITGGTVAYDYAHILGSCSFSGETTFEVTPDVVPPPPSPSSFLKLDTTVSPQLYHGYLTTRGPEFTVTATCDFGTSTRSHTPTNVWLNLLPDEYLAVARDGELITGTYRAETAFPGLGYSFVQESEYTVTRIR